MHWKTMARSRQNDSLLDASTEVAEHREERITCAYVRAYADAPLTKEEIQMLDAAADLAGELPLKAA
jgi:hypothetical protein